MVFHEYTGHLFLGSRKLFFNYIDMKAFNLALNPYIIPLQAFSYSFNVYLPIFPRMGCKQSVFNGHSEKLFVKRHLGPGVQVSPLDLGGKDSSKGVWDVFEVLSFHELYDANPDWMNMTQISWRWVEYLFIAWGWWGLGSMSKNTGCIKFKFMSIIYNSYH